MDRVSLLSLVVGSVLPLLTATVTKSSWPIWVKQLATAVFSAATGVGVALEHPGGVSAAVIAANALTTFATAAAVLAATWHPTGVLGRLEALFIRDTPAVAGNLTAIATDLRAASSAPSAASGTATATGADITSETGPGKG